MVNKMMAYAAICATAIATFAAVAAEVTENDAREAVRGWAALKESLTGGAQFNASAISDVKTCSGKDGKGVFYVVTFASGGYAVVSGDTDTEPILAYSSEDEWVDDESRNPILTMLKLDVAAMSETLSAAQSSGMRKLRSVASPESAGAKRWAKLRDAANAAGGRTRLLKSTVTTVTDEQMSAGDLRVAPLLKSKWGQGNVGGTPCYNYCTPLNRITGCVATMMAQIMYYHKWPQGSVTFGKKNRFGADRWSYGYGANSGRAQVEVESGTFGYYEVWANELLDNDGSGRRTLNGVNINGYQSTAAQAAQARYSCDLTSWTPAFGGTYDWANMLDDPQAANSAGPLTEANRLAIGHLVRDVGLTVPIRYEMGGGEGSAHATLALSLVDTFQYADAVFKSGVDADVFKRGILANLDAKLPVGVTIPGHAIVADGYGYVDDTLYVHFNMGWGGGGAWYRPPVIYEDASLGGSDNKYNTFNTILYNIRPQGNEAESIVSGRVLDPQGYPVPDVTVSAGGTRVSTTDAHGIYSLFLPAGEHVITVAVGTAVAQTNLNVAATTNPYIYKDATRNEGVEGRYTSVGNVWGVDLMLPEPSGMDPAWIDETADTAGQTGSWSGDFAWNAETKRGGLAGLCEFTPTVPSGGNLVNLSVDVAFPALEEGSMPPGVSAITAMQIGTNGSFQVLTGNGEQGTGNGWRDVAAEGVTPAVGTEYSFSLTLDYRVKLFSVALVDGFSVLPLAAVDGTTQFPFAVSNSTSVSSVKFVGEGSLAAIRGSYFTVEGFEKNEEIVVKDSARVILSAAQAAWLNELGDKATVANKAATVSAEDFGKAYLLNLDITQDGFGYTFEVTSISVASESVTIGVSLHRTGAVTDWLSGTVAPINGVLRFYGATTVGAFRAGAAVPVSSATLTNEDFADGETATAVFAKPNGTNALFKASIEE